ncbi:MAG: MBL fold metallo-hydrolase [Rhodospirillales bacterium]|nr:MBL fold metallo-hydrolase [Rhodospirillales bacterium]
MQNINSGIHHLTVGSATVTALNDLVFEAGTGVVAGLTAAEADAILSGNFRRLPARITVNAFLVTVGGQHVLVDTGVGANMGGGQVRARLARLGIEASAIRTVLITHAHVDHVSGLIDEHGAAYFPEAEIVMHEAEAGYWLDEAREAAAPEAAKGAFAIARTALAPYRSRLKLVKDGQEAVPGLRARHFPGHTPGHSGWLLDQGNDALLIWGDVVHLPGLQFREPKAGMLFDTDVEQARATRARVFDMASADRLRVCGMHLDFPTFGHVVKASEGYRFIPEVWMPTA